ncbi:MAG: 3-deoxy-7-phosphoheptulonate synthase [Victivallales bacterium]|nr:3-deoxy-7-phosphoheptulonate synthase [Victivallales bacterium]
MKQTSNVNILSQSPLPPPSDVLREYPLGNEGSERVAQSRSEIGAILDGRSRRFLMIVGPCSVHDESAALEYAARLKALSDEVNDRIMVVMRVYFEKPRTMLGWKGLIYDPDLRGGYDIERGIRTARSLLLRIERTGLPVGTEILDPVITQYIADVVSWAAIGARTTESQTHRQLVSGLSMPTGFKNNTDGSILAAIEAVKTANAEHAFIGIDEQGRSSIFRTRGNPWAHIVLRGGRNGPNYGSEHIAYTRELSRKYEITPSLIVDCSHANSARDPERQVEVMRDIVAQRVAGAKNITGAMLESYLETGSQKIDKSKDIKPNLSITDPCLGFEDTASLVREVCRELARR